MRIGEVAEQAGVTAKTLRYYERVGLLPEAERTQSGYRDYSRDIFDRLRFIRSAQAAGLSLGEVKSVIAFRDQGCPPCAHVLSLIERRAADLERRMDELAQLRDQLRKLARKGRSLSPADCAPNLVCHILNPPPN